LRVFVVTVSKRRLLGDRRLPPSVEARIEAAFKQPPWRTESTTRRDTWISPSGGVRLDVITNEPITTGPLIHRHASGRAATWTGHIGDPTFTGDGPPPEVVARLPGCYALAIVNDNGAEGSTTIHRIEQLYVAEGRDVTVLSTSARVAYVVSGQREAQPPLDALIGLSGPGFMLSNATPFPGVAAVPAGSRVVLSTNGKSVYPLPPEDIDPDAPLEELANAIADALVAAAATVGRTPWSKTVQLTGGKDSRLAAIALATAGVEFTAVTSGVETHPDVVVARHVASVLGVPHEVRPPAGAVAQGDRVEVWPLRRAYHALRGCDGMLTCYETLNIGGRYDEADLTLGGHGGELLRGGFAYGFPPSTQAAVEKRLASRTGPHRQLLTEAAAGQLDRIVAPWKDLITADPHRGSERFYRVIRTGRWHAVARGVYQIRGPRRSLLADNPVVRIASAARQDLAAEERLFHAVMHRLRPDVCAVPLYSKRWNFEKSKPSSECDPATWLEREPPPGGQEVAWNWKASYPAALHTYFTDTILAAPLFGSLLDRQRTEQFLADTLDRRAASQAQLVWALYTTSQLVAGLGSAPTEPDGPVFDIPIPRAEVPAPAANR
jgi:hypothetical protein